MSSEKVLVMGASPKPDRYSYLAACLLLDFGHQPYLFGRHSGTVRGMEIHSTFPENESFDTITMYMNAFNQREFLDKIVALKPKRIIFNPGSENEALYELLKKNKIAYEEACTLVLMRTGQY